MIVLISPVPVNTNCDFLKCGKVNKNKNRIMEFRGITRGGGGVAERKTSRLNEDGIDKVGGKQGA
jgi:hypothetical protein